MPCRGMVCNGCAVLCNGCEQEEEQLRLVAEANLSRAEFQYSMECYDSSMGLLEDYAGESRRESMSE